ncbi:hypothetical protein LTR85_009035 [Meristemomyces frigidus]|nr:hypothetical protein LTR85_009035 [Meristemomyces frigidus]
MADNQSSKREGTPTVGGAFSMDINKAKIGEAETEAPGVSSLNMAAASFMSDRIQIMAGHSELQQPTEEQDGGQDRDPSEASGAISGTTAGSGLSGTTDYDDWLFTTIDPGSEEWDIPAEKRGKVTSSLHDARLFGAEIGNTIILSIADEFPGLEVLQVQIHCMQDPTTASVDVMNIGHVRQMLKGRVIEPLLAGELRWAQDVELRLTFTYDLHSTHTGKTVDIKTLTAWQMAYTVTNSPADSFIIGDARAAVATESEDVGETAE